MDTKRTAFDLLLLAVSNIIEGLREGAPTGNRVRDAAELVKLARAAREAESKK
jgi:hypothetical protein